MNKYLLAILKEINTIIIPGLGALTITNADTGEIMFMPYLKHDDGKLAAHIAEKEGWEENDAKNVISKYVREIMAELDQGKSYDMFQFGTFFKNESGDIDFKNWDKSAPSTPEKEIITPTPIAKNEAEPKADVPKEESKIKDTKSAIELKKEEPVSIPKPKVASTVIPKVKATPALVDKNLDVAAKEEIAKGSKKLKALEKQKKEKPEKKKKGIGFWILTALLIIIIGGSTYIAIDYENAKQYIPFLAQYEEVEGESSSEFEIMQEMIGEEDLNSEEEEEEEEDISEDELTTENSELIEEEIQQEAPVEEGGIQEAVTNSPLPYHIIVGAFSSKENANRLAEKLRNEGNTVKVISGRGLTLVSAKAFATRNQAQKELTEFENGWIYKW